MKITAICTGLFSLLLGVSVGPAMACGEGMFTSGKGLPFQSYLAPNPASILILAEAPRSDEDRFYQGLERAGHELVVVNDEQSMQRELRARRFDIVISSLKAADTVAVQPSEEGWAPRLLPVVARSQRNSSELRSRFDLFVLDGASLGQYLSVINRALSAR